MKQKEKIIKFLKGQTCENCRHSFFRVDHWYCDIKGKKFNSLHTCVKYQQPLDGSLKVFKYDKIPINWKEYNNDGYWREI